MIIVRLKSENVKRLSAVEIVPDASVVRIAGKNGAGKSSVLDSISYAIGGKALIPEEPIRDGEDHAEVVVELADGLTVTRTFRRSRLKCDCAASPEEPANRHESHSAQCASHKFGETDSRLTVASKDGAQYRKPQEILDALYSSLTFDPLEFATLGRTAEGRRKQAKMLLDVAGLDFTDLEKSRKEAVERRASFRKQYGEQVALLHAAVKYDGVPAEEIGAEKIGEELAEAEKLRRAAAEANSAHQTAVRNASSISDALATREQQVALFRKQLEEAEALLQQVRKDKAAIDADVITLGKAHLDAQALVPDTAAIQARLKEIGETNEKIRANVAHANLAARVQDFETKAAAEDTTIEMLDKQRAERLAASKMPIEGLSINEDGVRLGEHPLEQASTSEQLRLSVAVGLAKSRLKVLLVRNGNALDSDSLALLTQMAEKAEAQIWMEWVADDGAPGAVVIEDGHVRP